MPRTGQFLDLANQKFGDWTALRQEGRNSYGQYFWICRCVCGAERSVLAAPLRRGRSTGCGCAARAARSRRMTTHGMKNTPPWNTWMAMRKRCRDPNNIGWSIYGGRGIRVCKEWDESFEVFWRDMKPAWKPGLTIERIDVNGHYEPGNCTWIPLEDQARNRRSNAAWRNVSTDLTGSIVGRWEVLHPVGKSRWGSQQWLCRCSCGTERVVGHSSLKLRKSKSCGCSRLQGASNGTPARDS